MNTLRKFLSKYFGAVTLVLFFVLFFKVFDHIQDKRYNELEKKYNNQLAMSDSLSQVNGGWQKRVLLNENLTNVLEKENKALSKTIKNKDEKIAALENVSIKWKGMYVNLSDSLNVKQSVDSTGTRYTVSFDKVDGITRVFGYTITNPPEAHFNVEWTRPLDLNVVLTKNNNEWFAYIDSPDTSFVPSELKVHVDRDVISDKRSWYRNFVGGVGIGLVGEEITNFANFGYLYDDKYLLSAYRQNDGETGLMIQTRF